MCVSKNGQNTFHITPKMKERGSRRLAPINQSSRHHASDYETHSYSEGNSGRSRTSCCSREASHKMTWPHIDGSTTGSVQIRLKIWMLREIRNLHNFPFGATDLFILSIPWRCYETKESWTTLVLIWTRTSQDCISPGLPSLEFQYHFFGMLVSYKHVNTSLVSRLYFFAFLTE